MNNHDDDLQQNGIYKFARLESYVKDYNEYIEKEEILLTIPKTECVNSLLYAITDKRIIAIQRAYYTDFDIWSVNSIKRTHLKKFFIKKQHFFSKLYNVIFLPDTKNYPKILFYNLDKETVIKIKEIIN